MVYPERCHGFVPGRLFGDGDHAVYSDAYVDALWSYLWSGLCVVMMVLVKKPSVSGDLQVGFWAFYWQKTDFTADPDDIRSAFHPGYPSPFGDVNCAIFAVNVSVYFGFHFHRSVIQYGVDRHLTVSPSFSPEPRPHCRAWPVLTWRA